MRQPISPKLRPVWNAFPGLTWGFCRTGRICSGYFKVSGTGTPIRWKASRWALVGLGERRDGDLGAGVPDLVAGQGGQVLDQPAEAAVGAACRVALV